MIESVFENASVGVFEGGGGVAVFATPVEAAALGDSYVSNSRFPGTSQRLDYRGWMHWANQLIGAPLRFRIAAMDGVNGETSAQILARVGTITALSPRPKFCFVSAGNNDVENAVATATTIANIAAIITALNAVGIIAVIGPVFARSTSTAPQIAATRTINAAVRAMAAPSRMIWTDWSSLVGADGLALANVLYDGIHPGTKGARAMAPWAAGSVGRRVSGVFPLASNASPGLMTNGLMAGTAGTVNFGFSGQNATGWTCYRVAAATGGTQTVAKVARTYGDGEWVQIALAGLTYTDTWSGGIVTPAVSYATAGLVEGDWAEFVVEVEVDPGAVNFEGIGVQVLDNNGSTTNQSNWTPFVSGGAAHLTTWSGITRMVIRTAPFQIRADAGTDSIQVRITLRGEAQEVGGITATARVGRATLRKVL